VMARLAAHAYATSFSAILLPRASQLPGASFWSGARLLRGLLLFGRLDTRLMQLAVHPGRSNLPGRTLHQSAESERADDPALCPQKPWGFPQQVGQLVLTNERARVEQRPSPTLQSIRQRDHQPGSAAGVLLVWIRHRGESPGLRFDRHFRAILRLHLQNIAQVDFHRALTFS